MFYPLAIKISLIQLWTFDLMEVFQMEVEAWDGSQLMRMREQDLLRGETNDPDFSFLHPYLSDLLYPQ